MTSTTTARPGTPARPRRLTPARLIRGRPGDPRWARPALLGLLTLTAVLYLAGLSRNGWANDFYAAAVQAGTKSWKAFFFGSFDSSNFITVDKTPASLWVMELSGRLFGVNYWSLLVPQALEGVASVALLHAAVRRWSGPAAGLLAGLVMALTPVAVLMFRFNNPDALLVLLMTAAAYAMVRAIEAGRTRWLLLAGALLGFAFLAKMLQAFLVLPGFALAYLLAGPPRLGKRLWQLALAGFALLASAGWWVLAAQLTPAAGRPYFGGSTDNSVLQLAIGYNGLGRLDGSETGSIGPGAGARAGGGAGRALAGAAGRALAGGTGAPGRAGGGGNAAFGGATGLGRLFSAEFGGQVSWLLPAALISLLVVAWVSRRAARTDRLRAAALLWGGWLLCTGLVFSYMSGIIHTYYTVALAPAIGALTGIGAATLWRARAGRPARLVAAAGLAVTAGWAYLLLDRTPSWLPWLRWLVLLAGLAAAGGVLAWPHLAALARTRRGRLALAGVPLVLGLFAVLAGPAGYAIDTMNTAHTGSLPTAGPQVTALGGGPGGGAPGTAGRSPATTGPGGRAGTRPAGTRPAGGGPGGSTRAPGGSRTAGSTPGGAGGPGGGLGGATQVSSALVRLLERGASGFTWVAATEGSQEAAPLELATGGDPVMAIGGFNGTDPAPTLAEFKTLVAGHKIHYYIGRNSESFGGGSGSSAIASWVAAHFTAHTVGGQTVYDLTQSSSGQ